jgi:hypothetical protein
VRKAPELQAAKSTNPNQVLRLISYYADRITLAHLAEPAHIHRQGRELPSYLEEIMRKAMIGMAGAMLGSILLTSGASAAPVMSHAAIKADPGYLTVAQRRARARVVRESRSDITSFSSSSSGVGVNHPPKK